MLRHRRKLASVKDPQAWLARIAWRVAVERKKKLPDVPLEDITEVARELRSRITSADDVLLASEMSLVLEHLVSLLPTKLRDPLTLSTIQELTPAQIASALGINEAAVRSRIFRARQILREKLALLLGGNRGT